VQYHLNGMYQEAISTYSLIVKNKQYPQSGRLRVNMGNIYFEQKNYPMAIKVLTVYCSGPPSGCCCCCCDW
jgi:intraflagellar transport protein 88